MASGHRAGRIGAFTVAVCVCLTAASTANASATARGRILSTPGRTSRWAFVTSAARVRDIPGTSGRVLGRLNLITADGTNELVELIAETRVGRHDWVDVRTSLRPSGTTGWVPRSALSSFHRVDTWLIVDKRSLRANLIRDGKVIFSAPVGIGKPSTPTPSGSFYIRDRLSGFASGSIYGPLAFGTSARSPVLTDWPGGAVVGVHGTNEPNLIPGRVSHGCVRMRDADILRLGRLMAVGTPVTIQ